MYFHCRAKTNDFVSIINENKDKFAYGIIHSCNHDNREIESFLELGLYFSLNTNSLLTK